MGVGGTAAAAVVSETREVLRGERREKMEAAEGWCSLRCVTK